MNQDVVLAIALPVTLFLIMFGMGSGLLINDFVRLKQMPAAILTGITAQMLLLPILAYILLSLFNISPELFVGFMILALSPGGTTSNLFSFMANGNLALSISLTAIVSLITPFTIPLVAGWVLAVQLNDSTTIHLPFLVTVLKLSVVTLVPVALGMLLRNYKSDFCIKYQILLTRIPFMMLLMVIAGIINNNWERMPEFITQTGFPTILLSSLALIIGYGFSRFARQNKQNSRTIAIETSIQNGGTAILVTGTILNNNEMTIAPVMYGILMLVPMFFYLAWFKYISISKCENY